MPSRQFYPWNAPPQRQKATKNDPLTLAIYYQSLLDSGQFENRAALARFLGVSRARVALIGEPVLNEQGPQAQQIISPKVASRRE